MTRAVSYHREAMALVPRKLGVLRTSNQAQRGKRLVAFARYQLPVEDAVAKNFRRRQYTLPVESLRIFFPRYFTTNIETVGRDTYIHIYVIVCLCM